MVRTLTALATLALTALATLALTGLAACGTSDARSSADGPALSSTRMDRYDWIATNSAPKGCLMEIVGGDFHWPGGSLYIPRASLKSGWGEEVSLHVVGPERKPLPDSVTVEFFSFLENQFYRGRFALPHDSLSRLFREGFEQVAPQRGRATYQAIIVGVAPGGAVAVWVAGSARQVEVFFGQAEPADLDFHRAFDAPETMDRAKFVADELANAAESDSLVPVMAARVPVGRWAAARARYAWRPVFEGLGTPASLGPVGYLNGEREHLFIDATTGALHLVDEAPTGPAARRSRPAPSVLSFREPTTQRSYQVFFDDAETIDAFARAGAGGGPVELVFAAPAAGGSGAAGALRLLVRGGAESVELRRARVDVVGGR